MPDEHTVVIKATVSKGSDVVADYAVTIISPESEPNEDEIAMLVRENMLRILGLWSVYAGSAVTFESGW